MGLKEAADIVGRFQRPDGHYNREEFWVVLEVVSQFHHVPMDELLEELVRRQQAEWGRFTPSF